MLNGTGTIRLWRRFTRAQWEIIRSRSIPCADGSFLYLGSIRLLGAEAGTLARHMITWIPQDTDVLFCTKKPIDMTNGISEEHPCIGFRRRCRATSPLASIMEIIHSGKAVEQHPLSERISDARLRRGIGKQQDMRTSRIAVIASAPIACPGTTELLVLFTFRSGYWSFCSEVPITCYGKQYHIGCLNHLDQSPKPNGIQAYSRYELAVFHENGLVSNRKLTEDVYAKYLFLSFV